jgi:hypothetical protein
MLAQYHKTPYGYDACVEDNCQFPYHFEIVEDQSPTGESINKRYQLVQDKSFHATPEMFCKTLQGELDNISDDLDTIQFKSKEAHRRVDKIAEQLSWLSAILRGQIE